MARKNNVPYDFGMPFLESSVDTEGFPNYDATDRHVSWFVMTLYTNFAKYGNPTPQPVSGVTWQQFTSSHRAYLRVDANPEMVSCFDPISNPELFSFPHESRTRKRRSGVENVFDPRRMAFWNNYYPKLVQVEFGVPIEVVNIFLQVILALFVVIVFGCIAGCCSRSDGDQYPRWDRRDYRVYRP